MRYTATSRRRDVTRPTSVFATSESCLFTKPITKKFSDAIVAPARRQGRRPRPFTAPAALGHRGAPGSSSARPVPGQKQAPGAPWAGPHETGLVCTSAEASHVDSGGPALAAVASFRIVALT